MSVIGIDLGNESCYIAVGKAGGIETIANDYSLRATPSVIAFSDKNRILGVAAKNQQVTNLKNTVYGLKRIIGRKFRDPHVQNELKHLTYDLVECEKGNIGVKVNYLNAEQIFSPEQCLAMLLTKLKQTAAQSLQMEKIKDCVISVPSYYTNNERLALLHAAKIADLNVLRLFNETAATALAYGIYKQDLPGAEEKPRVVVFVDCGQSSLQISACAFNKDKLKVLATVADGNLGGRDFDMVLAEYFCKEFETKYHINAKSNKRAFLRLLSEVEKVKKQMSANSTPLPLNIECFMNDKDVHSTIKRADYEAMCSHLLKRIQAHLEKLLHFGEFETSDVYSVELVGGSTRIPAIKQVIEAVLGKAPSTTLNQDEAVSRGCALQCAILSPAMRVREFQVKDVQMYPIEVQWDPSTDGTDGGGQLEAFPANHPVPFSKMLIFHRQEPITIRAMYVANDSMRSDSGKLLSNIPYPDHYIGTWIVKDVRPSLDGKPQKVKVKVRININGIMTVTDAHLYEAKGNDSSMEIANDNENKNHSSNMNNDTGNDVDMKHEMGEENAIDEGGDVASSETNCKQSKPSNADQSSSKAAEENNHVDKQGKKVGKASVKSVELPIEDIPCGISQVELNNFFEQECKMIATDKQEKERVDARNTLEEYVYELRGRLSSDGELAPYALSNDRVHLTEKLDAMENWLYEEGEDCQKRVYHDKLDELKALGDPIQQRKIEYEVHPHVQRDFAKLLQQSSKIVNLARNGDAKYAHLTSEEVSKMDELCQGSMKWLDQVASKIQATPKHLLPPVLVTEVKSELKSFDSQFKAIANKPCPKAPTPPPATAAPTNATSSEPNGASNTKTKDGDSGGANATKSEEDNKTTNNMEWSEN